MGETLRIIELRIENVKRIKAVHIKPDGDVVQISGRNAQGKSAVLDSMEMLIGGKRHVCKEPVRRGEDSGYVIASFGQSGQDPDFVAERKFTADGGTSLTMRSKHGANVPSPQAVMDGIVNDFSFDPMKFKQLSGRDQAAALRTAVGLDFSEIDATRDKAFTNRTIVNRDLAAAKSQLAVMSPGLPGTPDKEISVTAISNELAEALRLASDLNIENRVLSDHRENVARIRRELVVAEEACTSQEIRVCDQPEPPDIIGIRDRMATSETTNMDVRAKIAHENQRQTVERLQSEVGALTDKINVCEFSRSSMLSDAKMPLPGLAFDENDELTYNGFPFSQASQAEQLRVVVALAMATNPRLRLMRIYDGSLLDAESMTALEELARERDMQIWIERVEGDGSGIVIEDGSILNGKDGDSHG